MITIARAERTVTLCTDLSLKADHERAEADLDRALKVGDRRETDTTVRDAAQVVRDVEELMRASTLVFHLRAWPRSQWLAFEEAHPPREGREDDKYFNIDISSLDDAIASSIVKVVDHEGAEVDFDASEWAPLADQLSHAQWEPFAVAVLNANRGVTEAPFSQAASRATRRSAPS